MTQLEILELAYGAAVDQWSAAKEKNEAAKEEGRPNTIYEHREKEYWKKVAQLEAMMRAEREAFDEAVRRAREVEA